MLTIAYPNLEVLDNLIASFIKLLPFFSGIV